MGRSKTLHTVKEGRGATVEEEGHGDVVTADIRLREQESERASERASSRSCAAAHHEQMKRESEGNEGTTQAG
jgi:hypothetical protein